MNTDTSIRPWRGFIITPDDKIDIVFDDEAWDRSHERGLFNRLLSAGYPVGPIMLGAPAHDAIIDLSIDPTDPEPEVTAYLTHKDPTQRERKMGEASSVFLDWYRRWLKP